MTARRQKARAASAGAATRRIGRTAAAAVVALASLTACTASPAGPVASSNGSTSNESTTAPTAMVTAWPAPTASPEIAAAQSKVGSVGETVLTWSDATTAIGVTVDYVTDYTPAAGFSVPAGERAIQIDLRVVNAGDQPLDLSGWSVYAAIDDQPLVAVQDSNYVPIATLPPVAANSNGYVPARVLIPAAGGTVLIGVTDPAYPDQPATFAATLS